MAADLTFPVREAVVAFLRTNTPLTALIPAEKIFGQVQPANTAYPFVRFGTPGATPLDYSCQVGSTVTVDLHVFAEDEQEACVIGAEIVTALDEANINLDPIGSLDARWTGGQTLRDPREPDIWHVVQTFEFEAGL